MRIAGPLFEASVVTTRRLCFFTSKSSRVSFVTVMASVKDCIEHQLAMVYLREVFYLVVWSFRDDVYFSSVVRWEAILDVTPRPF